MARKWPGGPVTLSVVDLLVTFWFWHSFPLRNGSLMKSYKWKSIVDYLYFLNIYAYKNHTLQKLWSGKRQDLDSDMWSIGYLGPKSPIHHLTNQTIRSIMKKGKSWPITSLCAMLYTGCTVILCVLWWYPEVWDLHIAANIYYTPLYHTCLKIMLCTSLFGTNDDYMKKRKMKCWFWSVYIVHEVLKMTYSIILCVVSVSYLYRHPEVMRCISQIRQIGIHSVSLMQTVKYIKIYNFKICVISRVPHRICKLQTEFLGLHMQDLKSIRMTTFFLKNSNFHQI